MLRIRESQCHKKRFFKDLREEIQLFEFPESGLDGPGGLGAVLLVSVQCVLRESRGVLRERRVAVPVFDENAGELVPGN
jgi:hypothetical protein